MGIINEKKRLPIHLPRLAPFCTCFQLIFDLPVPYLLSLFDLSFFTFHTSTLLPSLLNSYSASILHPHAMGVKLHRFCSVVRVQLLVFVGHVIFVGLSPQGVQWNDNALVWDCCCIKITPLRRNTRKTNVAQQILRLNLAFQARFLAYNRPLSDLTQQIPILVCPFCQESVYHTRYIFLFSESFGRECGPLQLRLRKYDSPLIGARVKRKIK